MYGGPAKLRRTTRRHGGITSVGGGASSKRASFPPPSSQLSQPLPSTGRLPLGSSRLRSSNNHHEPTATSSSSENFSLVPGNNPLAFGMIIRLTPDLVEEIRRVESEEGGSAKIKFDSIGNNPSGNVINVDGKEFRFTWSHEFGDLCDIYEERRNGEDGNDLLVESGSAWRKLNVQRVLDESMTNHVKMRSEEANRKHKSRKAIVLDHSNPSMKSQLKQIAAVETNPWRNSKQKKEPPFKKRKVDSPLAAPHIQPIHAKNKQNAASSKKEFPSRASNALRETPEPKRNFGTKGMSLKVSEKAVEDTIPISAKKMESTVKKIANFKAPGVDFDNSKKTLSEIGSSREDKRRSSPALEEKAPAVESEGQTKQSTDVVGEKKAPKNSEERPRGSSDIDSDSGSDSGSSSESDASLNSKEGSNEDMDIASDGDKGQEQKILTTEKQHGDSHGSDVGTEKGLPDDKRESGMAIDFPYEKSSFEKSEKRPRMSDSDFINAEPSENRTLDSEKPSPSNTRANFTYRWKNLMPIERISDGQKTNESSSDEDAYFKYEKDEAEPKGPIENIIQCKEYVKEYHDKFFVYSSLHDVIQSYGNEKGPRISEMGMDLEIMKGTDRYYEIFDKLKESYDRCGVRIERLMKIFLVLDQEIAYLWDRIEEFVDKSKDESQRSDFIKAKPSGMGTLDSEKSSPSNTKANFINKGKETMSIEGIKKTNGSSSDEYASYFKYEKNEAEPKGPIKDIIQYKEYVKEYNDKYPIYSSLEKITVSIGNEFSKMAKDLDSEKGTDRYNEIFDKLKESYAPNGTRQRLKKIFVGVYQELTCLKQRIQEFVDEYNKKASAHHRYISGF